MSDPTRPPGTGSGYWGTAAIAVRHAHDCIGSRISPNMEHRQTAPPTERRIAPITQVPHFSSYRYTPVFGRAAERSEVSWGNGQAVPWKRSHSALPEDGYQITRLGPE